MTEQRKPNKAGAIAIAVALAASTVAAFEGYRSHPYFDVAGVKTVCRGHTGGVEDRTYSRAECDAMFSVDLQKHAEGVVKCVPGIAERPEILAASSSLAFNIGVARFCRSTAARRFNAGDLAGGCRAIGAYVYAGGRKLPGLVRRRAAEVALCLRGVK